MWRSLFEGAFEKDSNPLKFALDQYKSKEMYKKLISRELNVLESFPDDSNTKNLYGKYI